MLNVIKASSDGSGMAAQDSWINLPVGYNLYDHVGVSTPSQIMCRTEPKH